MKKLKLLASILLISGAAATAPVGALCGAELTGKVYYPSEIAEFKQAVELSKSDKELFRIMTNLEKILKIYSIMPDGAQDLLKLREVYMTARKKLSVSTLNHSYKGTIVQPCYWGAYDSDCCDQSIVKLRMAIEQMKPPKKRARLIASPNIRKAKKRVADDNASTTPRLVSQDLDMEIEDFVL